MFEYVLRVLIFFVCLLYFDKVLIVKWLFCPRCVALISANFRKGYGDDVISNDIISDDIIGNDIISDDVTGSDQFGDDVIGNDTI